MAYASMILDERVIFLLGVINLLSLVMVFFSCRCLIGHRFVERMWKYGWYRLYHQGHCYYWWLLAISVFLHSAIALALYGNPF